MTPQFQRALILLQQNRDADAVRELRQVLAAEPRDASAHAILSLCLSDQDELKEATTEAELAIGIEPELPVAHYARAHALLKRNRTDDAYSAAKEAVRLDPSRPDYFSLLGAVEMQRRNWPGALEQAENGLAIDADHDGSINLRAMALVKLGRRDEARRSINGALARDPENPTTHANQGWTLLHGGDHKQAMIHFREALRLDPNSDWAKSGMVEAIKSGFFPYRWLLMFFLWMKRLSRRGQWAVILGAYFGYQVLRVIANRNPAAGRFLWPILIAYIVFVIMTWVAVPLLNLTLRLHRFGRYALSRDQITAANWIGAMLGIAIVSLACGWFWRFDPLFDLAIVAGFLIIPISGAFGCQRGWPRHVMLIIAAALAGIGLFSVWLTMKEVLYGVRAGREAVDAFIVFIIGAAASTFVSNALRMVRPRT